MRGVAPQGMCAVQHSKSWPSSRADERDSAEAALHHEWFLLEPAPAPHAVVAAAVAAMLRARAEQRAAQRAEEAAWREMYGC